MENLPELLDCTLPELKDQLKLWNEPAYRAEQIYSWLYQKGVDSFEGMSNLSGSLQSRLSQEMDFGFPEVLQTAEDRGAEKFVLQLRDGNLIESVRIKGRSGSTFCLSTQVGCNLSCRFCASGQMAYRRNLTAGEIIAQVLLLEHTRERPSHIVYMGMGEPFLNYEATLKSLSILQEAKGYQFGARRITVSTVGIVPEIYRFAREAGQVNLAISLHATTDTKREELMPIARLYNLRQLLQAAWDYTEVTRRRVSFEYVLILGFNDSHHDADRLIEMLKDKLAHLNIIPFNPIERTTFDRPDRKEMDRFVSYLQQHGVNATIRQSAGTAVAAACGQLAGKLKNEE